MRVLLVGLIAIGCGSGKDKEASKDAARPTPVFDFVAEVPGHGYAPLADDSGIVVIASQSAIVVEGKSIVALNNGAVDASQLQDRAIPRLTTFVTALDGAMKAKNQPPPAYLLALDRKHPFQLLVQIISSLKSTNAKQFGILARTGNRYMQLPLVLPERPAIAHAPPNDVTSASDSPPSKVGMSIKVTDKSAAPDTTLTPDMIVAKVQSVYVAGIKRCHKRAVEVATTDTLEIAFAIGPIGRVTAPVVKAPNQAIGDCVAGQMMSWRFPIPKDEDGEPTSTTAKLVLSLTIDPVAEPGTIEPQEVMGPVPPSEEQPLGMAVAITKLDVMVFSLSGLEGTFAQPLARFPLADAAAQLPAALYHTVQRRWGGGKQRPDADREIIVMADAAIPMDTLAPLLGAVRATADGSELFPRILLSSGFE